MNRANKIQNQSLRWYLAMWKNLLFLLEIENELFAATVIMIVLTVIAPVVLAALEAPPQVLAVIQEEAVVPAADQVAVLQDPEAADALAVAVAINFNKINVNKDTLCKYICARCFLLYCNACIIVLNRINITLSFMRTSHNSNFSI